jgi:hypothetical protein
MSRKTLMPARSSATIGSPTFPLPFGRELGQRFKLDCKPPLRNDALRLDPSARLALEHFAGIFLGVNNYLNAIRQGDRIVEAACIHFPNIAQFGVPNAADFAAREHSVFWVPEIVIKNQFLRTTKVLGDNSPKGEFVFEPDLQVRVEFIPARNPCDLYHPSPSRRTTKLTRGGRR